VFGPTGSDLINFTPRLTHNPGWALEVFWASYKQKYEVVFILACPWILGSSSERKKFGMGSFRWPSSKRKIERNP
jgi:hypothetical protein